MIVCGMPSHYAEYVQASSRTARTHPGIVFVCFTAHNVREASQYELFGAMHEHLDRLIEPVAINRFATNAPRKTMPGLISGLLLNVYTPKLLGGAIGRSLDDRQTAAIALGFQPSQDGTNSGAVNRAELLGAIEMIIGVDRARPPATEAQIAHVREKLAPLFEELCSIVNGSFDKRLVAALKPLTSFRDIDEPVDIEAGNAAQAIDRLGRG
jgi:hypothetical protein